MGNDNLGTLTQTTITGLEMVSTSTDRLYSLTIGATTTEVTFHVTVGGVTKHLTLAVGFSAEQLQAALQALLFPVLPDAIPRPFTGCGTRGGDGILNTRCAQSVFVWQHGGDFLIGFRGELHGLAVGFTVTPTNSPAGATATDLARMDGINYYGFATRRALTILLGCRRRSLQRPRHAAAHRARQPAPATTSSTSPTPPTSARSPPPLRAGRPRPPAAARG